MATTTSSAVLVPVAPVFSNTERLALAGFLAGYSGLTRQAYELDLRQYAAWCQQHQLRLFAARRADIECFARDLETRGRARATGRGRRGCLSPSLGPGREGEDLAVLDEFAVGLAGAGGECGEPEHVGGRVVG